MERLNGEMQGYKHLQGTGRGVLNGAIRSDRLPVILLEKEERT